MEQREIEDAQHCTQVATPAAPPLFSLREAQVVRAGRTILNVERFDLAEGEHVALLGPNGAGKSTFIQLLTREIFPLHRDERPVRFRGQARPVLADIKQALGIVSATMHDQVRVHLDGEIPVSADITPAALADLRLTVGSPAWAGVKATEVECYPA